MSFAVNFNCISLVFTVIKGKIITLYYHAFKITLPQAVLLFPKPLIYRKRDTK